MCEILTYFSFLNGENTTLVLTDVKCKSELQVLASLWLASNLTQWPLKVSFTHVHRFYIGKTFLRLGKAF